MRKDLLIKLNSLLAVCLAILFFCFFQFTKHDPVLAAILPYHTIRNRQPSATPNAPMDAVGSNRDAWPLRGNRAPAW